MLGIVLSGHTDAVGEARLAESAGLSFVAAGEHVFFNGPTSNAFVTLAAAAAATTRVRLVSTVTLLPLYRHRWPRRWPPPWTGSRTAGSTWASASAVSPRPSSRHAASRSPNAAPEPTRPFGLMRLLFTGKAVTFQGRYSSMTDLTLSPTPAARLPIWIGGRRDAAMRRAARFGDVWLPYMYTPKMLADSLTRIRSLAPPSPVTGAVFMWLAVDRDAARARSLAEAKLRAVYRQNTERLLTRYVPAGDPATVAARLREYVDAGAERIVCALACPDEARPTMIELLAGEVRSALSS